MPETDSAANLATPTLSASRRNRPLKMLFMRAVGVKLLAEQTHETSGMKCYALSEIFVARRSGLAAAPSVW
jgi:hypothetical protein